MVPHCSFVSISLIIGNVDHLSCARWSSGYPHLTWELGSLHGERAFQLRNEDHIVDIQVVTAGKTFKAEGLALASLHGMCVSHSVISYSLRPQAPLGLL